MTWRQMPLDWPAAAAMTAENFVLSDSNRAARLFLDRWPDWPERALAIYGPEGCGKTHLGAIWQARSGAVFADADLDLATLGPAPRLIFDEIVPPEETFFHLLNRLRASDSGFLLILSRQAPARWPILLPDLASRLAAIPSVAVAAPDDALLAALLAKHFADRQIAVEADVIAYLLRQMERSFAAAAAIAERLDRASLAAGRPITIPLARRLLAERDPGEA